MKRKEAYWDEEEGVYHFRGSFYGGCMHSVVLALRGNSPKAPSLHTRARFSAGTQSEDELKKDMVEVGLAILGPPDGTLGVIWDAGAHFSCQRQTKAYFGYCDAYKGFAYSDGLKGLQQKLLHPQDGSPPVSMHVYTIGCSLDGWGISPLDFLVKVQDLEFYNESVSRLLVSDGVVPFVLEHKSMNADKKAALDACCPSRPYVLDRYLFRELMRSYGWQITAQVLGVQTLMDRVYRQPVGNHYPLDSVDPDIFLSVEVLKQHGAGGSYFPTGRYLYKLDGCPYSGAAVAERLAMAVDKADRGDIPECDSEWDCSWTQINKPERNTKPPDVEDIVWDDGEAPLWPLAEVS